MYFRKYSHPHYPRRQRCNITGDTRERRDSPYWRDRFWKDYTYAHLQAHDYYLISRCIEIPQYILESGLAGNGMIAVTQPRRVAATSLANRVAAEKGTEVGHLVGYSVRFDEASSEATRIKYVTDGMLVRELLSDPTLSRYSVIIVDEAHERTLRTDILMANLKTIQQKRNAPTDRKGKGPAAALNPLKIVIMSATLDAEKFSKFYDK